MLSHHRVSFGSSHIEVLGRPSSGLRKMRMKRLNLLAIHEVNSVPEAEKGRSQKYWKSNKARDIFLRLIHLDHFETRMPHEAFERF